MERVNLRLTWFLCLIGFFLLGQSSLKCEENFSFKINPKAVGVIIDKKENREIGSAFLVGTQKHIVTCAHVATEGDFQFKGVSLSSIDLKTAYYLPKYDLSVFTLSKPVDGNPLKFGDIKKIRPGDTVVYIGWDKNVSQMLANKAIVSAIGSAVNGAVVIDFLEFEGKGIPGYSGGPVFDINGNVIAMMREAWLKQGVKGGQAILINRAFSVEIVSILDSEVYSNNDNKNATPLDTDSLKKTINVKNE